VKQSLGLAHAGRAGVIGRPATAAVCQAAAFALLRGAASTPLLAATAIANITIKMRVISASYRVITVPIEACASPPAEATADSLRYKLACQPKQRRREGWWAMTDSNRRHPACKAGALPAELIARSLSLIAAGQRMASAWRPGPINKAAPARAPQSLGGKPGFEVAQ
jgi:hypothetical protein